jgi:hypothetical protein
MPAEWTISDAKTFRRCPKQWYYRAHFGNALAKKEPLRREAFVLGAFQTIDQWRGMVVDNVIESVVVPSLKAHRPLNQRDLLQEADAMFDRQLAFAKDNRVREAGFAKSKNKFAYAALLDVEEGREIPDEVIAKAREDVHCALRNLWQLPELRAELKAASHLVAQKPFRFKLRGQSIVAVPDLVAFYHNRPPLIVDWKVHAFGLTEARTQLLIYAMALVRSRQAGGSSDRNWLESEVVAREVQLLTRVMRTFQLDADAAVEMEDYILSSLRAMDRVTEGKPLAEVAVADLPAVYSDDGCVNCGFKSICWEQPSSS